jgi:hypothetical protein
LFCSLDDFVQSLNRILRIIDPFILSGQSMKGVPDEEFGLGLKGGGEVFEKALHSIFFIGQNINDGGLRQDELL